MSYKAGTVTTVANNATITGTNTQWANTLYNVVKGQIIVITQGTNTDIYTIEEIKSNTSLVLSRPAVRSTTNATYEILTTLNNSVSDDTIKLGNEIVAMSDFMRIMQAWTTSSQSNVKVTWGTQEITIATVSGLQKQIDDKYSRKYQSIPPNTNLDTFYETGFWSQSVSANALIELGYPIELAGWLDVYPTTASMCRQEYTVYNNAKDKFYRTVNTTNGTATSWVRNTSEGMNYARLYKYGALPLRALYGSAIGPNPNGREYMLLGPADASNDTLQEQTFICGTIMAMRGSKVAGNRTTAYDILYNNSYNAFNLRVSSRNGTTNGFVSTVVTAMYRGVKCAFIQLATAGGQPSSGAIFDGVVNTYDPRISFDDIFSIVYEKDLSQISEHSIPRMMVDAGYVAEQLESKFDKSGGEIIGNTTVRGLLTAIDNSNKAIQVTPSSIRTKTGTVWVDHVVPDSGGTFMQVGDFGIGAERETLLGKSYTNSFVSYSGSDGASRDGWPANGAGWQSQYASNRRSQLYITAGNVLKYRWTQIAGADTTTPWFNVMYDGEEVSLSQGDLENRLKSSATTSKIFRNTANTTKYSSVWSPVIYAKSGGTWNTYSIGYTTGSFTIGWGDGTSANAAIVYTTINTTKDANGNLKAASPVVQIFKDKILCNDESEGVEMERLGVGKYLIKNVLGLNSDPSWGGIHGGIVIPKGINDLNLFWADYKVLADGNILLTTNYRKYTDLPSEIVLKRLTTYPEFMDENGNELESYAPCDIPNGHWVDMRVQMPENSIYNVRARAQQNAMFYSSLVEYQNSILKNDIKQLN